ncbi:hypothetical protein FACS1894186_5210 [Alphaproteobacteria bacterium]|nr:hypothetical protein FACS1894186_5210 [Alphaproteobacteria bacterium]
MKPRSLALAFAALLAAHGAARAQEAGRVGLFARDYRRMQTAGGQEMCSMEFGARNMSGRRIYALGVVFIFGEDGEWQIPFSAEDLADGTEDKRRLTYYGARCAALRTSLPRIRAKQCQARGATPRECAALLQKLD